MKKALAIIFCADNTNKNSNVDKNIININNYINEANLTQDKNPIIA